MNITSTAAAIVLTGLAAASLTACSGSAPAPEGTAGSGGDIPATTIRLAIPDPASSAVGLAADHFAEKASELSDGAVTVEVFPDGTLFGGDQNAAVNLLGNGTLDATIISTSVYSSFDPRLNAISLPYLFEDTEQYSEYLAGEPGQELLAALDEQNIEGLTLLSRTPRVTTNSDRAIEAPEDFKGLKIRVPQNELWVKFFSALGANPTPMDFKEVYTALQLGTIDGQENPLEVPVANKFFEVQSYLSLTNHMRDAFILGFSKSKFDGYDTAVQDVLTEAAASAAEFKVENDEAFVEETLANLEDQGVEVNELSDSARQEFEEFASALYPEFEALIGAEFMQSTLEFVGR